MGQIRDMHGAAQGAPLMPGRNAGRRFCVVGAGISGLAAATALAQQGARVTVLERARDIGEIGAGLQISPNGMAALAALGVETRAAAAIGQVELRDGLTGGPVLSLNLERAGYAHPYLAWHRVDLIGALELAARRAGVDIRTGAEVSGIEGGAGDGPIVRLADGTTQRPEAVIGADGIRSACRRALLPAAAARFTGHVAWRALVPDPGDTAPVARVWMMPGRHVVSYPLKSRGLINLVAVREQSDWVEESWRQPGAPDALRAAFEDAAPDLNRLLSAVETCHLWGLFRHPVPEDWGRGAALMIGDAVHPTLPFLAQGASMGLEDAVLLSRITDRSSDLAEAFSRFTRARVPRTRRIVAAANANARLYHLGPVLRRGAYGALRLGGALFPKAGLKRFDWLYRFDPTGPDAWRP